MSVTAGRPHRGWTAQSACATLSAPKAAMSVRFVLAVHDVRMESLGRWLGTASLILAAVFAALTLWSWGSHVPLTSTGELCGARVYSFRPGHGTSAGSGEMSPEARRLVDAPCQAAAKPYWDRGVWYAWGAGGAVLAAAALSTASRQTTKGLKTGS